MDIKPNSYRNPLAIRRILVRQLFGIFDYDLHGKGLDELSKVFILYGDNGSGKTTVLRLVFHLLAPEHGESHKTYLARTQFSELTVELANGVKVSAERAPGGISGPYRLSLVSQDSLIAEAEVSAADGAVLQSPELDSFLKAVRNLGLAIFYLSDSRVIKRSGYRSQPTVEQMISHRRKDVTSRHLIETSSVDEDPRHEERLVETAVSRAVQWFRGQYLRGAKIGQDNANSIYRDVISQIANASSSRASKVSLMPNQIIATLMTLTERNNSFSSFGLTTPMALEDFVGPLRQAGVRNQGIIISVLQPYLDGLNARLDALQDIQELIALFVGNLNSFYSHKQITFNLSDGLRIISDHNTRLSPRTLSSGERQLLLMFCNVLSSRDHAGIFIIDEPEISLNVKWQRRLLDALLDCTRGSNIQFLIASHSIEFIAPHENSVIKLETV